MGSGACAKLLLNRELATVVDSYHALKETPGWKLLSAEQREKYDLAAGKIDEAAIKRYRPLLDDMAQTIDGSDVG